MLRNIHPNPDKRMTPQETKTFFVSVFYECWVHSLLAFHSIRYSRSIPFATRVPFHSISLQ
jgi:hypothetical protein